MQKKWKNLRDVYVKEIKKTKNLKSGSSAPTTSSFAHFQRLSFLKPVVQKRATDNSLDVEEISTNVDLNSINSSVNSPTTNVPRKKYKLHPADEHFANILERSINTRNNNITVNKEDDDEDRFFCLSLVKEIKKVSENRRLRLKMEIYNVLERYQSAQAQPFEDFNYASDSYNSQRQPRNNSTSFGSPEYSDTMRYSNRESSTQYGRATGSYTSPPTTSSQDSNTTRYSNRESSTQYGYTTGSYTSLPTKSLQVTSPGSYEDSEELDLFNL